MAISKEQLLKLMSRPEMTSMDDLDEVEVQPENIDDALKQHIENPESMLGEEEEMEEPELQASIAPASKLPKEQYTPDRDIMAKIKKLKEQDSGLEDQEVAKETISDASAPMQLRKDAIEQIKRKYLGK